MTLNQMLRRDSADQQQAGMIRGGRASFLKSIFTVYCRRLRNATIAFSLGVLLQSSVIGAQQRTSSYTLASNSTTSAGVYMPDGRLVRTLWSNEPRTAGVQTVNWDGLDDLGNSITNTGLQARVIAHNVKYVWEGVIGNSSDDLIGPNKHRSFFFINDMKFSGTNGIFCVGYNELQTMLYTLSPTNVQSRRTLIDYEDYRRNFSICATDGALAYFANTGGAEPATFVIAGNLSNVVEQRWSFGANGVNFDPWTSVIDAGTSAITGLAVQKNGNYLFVSHRDENVVKVFHKKTGAFIKQISVANPNRLAVNANDELWVVNSNNGTVKLFNNLTNAPTLAVTISGFSFPLALGVSPVDSTLVVVDGGTSHQLKGFNQSGTPLWTYGQAGGYPATGANAATNKFWFTGSFLAFTADGSFWVGDNGNSRAMNFDRNLNYKDRLQYLPFVYKAAVDLGNPTRVFANWLEFVVDYSKPIQQSWTFVRNWAVAMPTNILTNNSGLNQVMTLSNGRTYALIAGVDQNGFNETAVLELLANGQVRECYRMQTDWHTFQADGSLHLHWFIADGYLPIYRKRLLGFDANNNPTWSANELIASVPASNNDDPWPRGFSGPIQPRYNISSSGMIMTFATQRGSRWHLGGVRTNSNTFAWKSMPEQAWEVDANGWVINPKGTFDPSPAVSYAGNQSMTVGRNTILGFNGEFWGGGQANQWIHFYDNGLFVGQFGKPLFPNANGDAAQPETAGNDFAPTLIKHNNKLYLYHNDESAHAGMHRWRVDGWDQINEIIAPFDQPVTVSLTSPANLAAFTPPAIITINATATANSGFVTRVEFYQGSTFLGQDTLAPYTLTWSSVPAGSYSLTARAFSSTGASSTSAVAAVTVSVPNQAPTVTLTSPANGANFSGPANISLAATASDPDGSIALVEFYNGTTKLGEDTTAPYSFIWSNVTAGTFQLTARAVDNVGGSSGSAAASITVVGPPNVAPTVALTAPANGNSFSVPATVTLTATAADTDGTVTKVEFFEGANKLGESASPPYSYTWSGALAGSYSLTARATDNAGAATTSAATSITVTNAPGSTNLINGLKGEYFNSPNLTSLALTRVDPLIQFNWGNSAPGAGVQPDQFSARWTGKVQPRYTETYLFHGLADDQIRLWVNGTMVFNGWSGYSSIDIVGFISLQANQYYDIVLEYADAFGNAGINLYWSSATQTKEIIPTSRLFTPGSEPPPNQAPTVQLTAPADGATTGAPATITLTATANDADGSISKVEFYTGVIKLGEDTTAPYAYTWSGVAAGSYTLTARAIDNAGANATSSAAIITVSAPANVPPTVALTGPADGAMFTAPATLTLMATASDSDGTISRVEFYNGATRLGEDSTAPYSFTWSGASAGLHVVSARAVDNLGATANSSAIEVTVNPAANLPPTVALTAPANGTALFGPANLVLTATAADSDGTIAKVEFYEGLNKLGQATSAPFTFAWNNVAPGNYFISAVAYDNANAAVLSAPATVAVVRPGISSGQRQADGSFLLAIPGAIGRTNSIQVSSDLETWSLLTNAVNATGALLVSDPEAAILARRFYRVWVDSLFLSNVVGFARVAVPPGYSLIANSFIPDINSVVAIFGTNVPSGTTLNKFRPATGDFAINPFDGLFGEWQAPNQTFGNGEGAFLQNPGTNSFQVTFQGQVPQGLLSTTLSTGYSIVGPMLPQAGLLQTDLQFPGAGGDTVYVYRNGRYLVSQYDPLFQAWDAEPDLNVGEGFFLFKTTAANWNRSFSATDL